MNELNIKKICAGDILAKDIPSILDKENIGYNRIDNVNWKEYPYRPDVSFRIAHTENSFLLHYKVTEDSIRAVAAHDNGPVWEDACVEFFSVPADDGIYYNIECNCAGRLLIGAGPQREGRQRAPQEILDTVQRWTSLGDSPFEEKVGECSWEAALAIPYSAFFLHNINSLDGRSIRANFYKCGDLLQKPHFLSWNPIPVEKPDFHRPDHFGLVNIE